MSAELRARLARAFDDLGSDRGREFARFLRGDDDDAPPCWGNIAETFPIVFDEDDERLAVFEHLVVEDDRAALLLFLDANRSRPPVLAGVLAAAPRLTPSLQRVAVAVARSAGMAPTALVADALHPAAREMAQAPEDALARELARFAGPVSALRALRVRAEKSQRPALG